jgi:hypothetical protein
MRECGGAEEERFGSFSLLLGDVVDPMLAASLWMSCKHKKRKIEGCRGSIGIRQGCWGEEESRRAI